MNSRFPFDKDTSITVKFSAGIGLLIFLILLVALTGFFSLNYVKRADYSIQQSTRIQAMILEMDGRMHKARHNHAQFFVNYPRIGLEEAHIQYAQPAIRETATAVQISNTLRQLLSQPHIGLPFKETKVDLNLYLSSAKRFADTSIESIELVTRLTAGENGLEPQLNQTILQLEEVIIRSNLFDNFHELEHFIFRHQISRERHEMQSAFNKAFELNKMIPEADLTLEQKNMTMELLRRFHFLANEILDIDVAINSKFKDFILQESLSDQASEKLIQVSKGEVKRSELKILQTYRIAAIIIITVLIIGLKISGFIAYLLHINITRRILNLTESAEKLKNGDFETMVLEGSPDELGLLEKTFNFMAAKMKNLILTLEEKVRERTLKLSKTNAELQKEIKDRQSMEEQLRQSHKMEAIGTLAGGIAHEFNNILGIIIGNAELAMDDTPEWNPAAENIKKIKKASLRAKDVVQQLLSFSRKTEQQQKPVDIAMIVKESIRLIRSSLPSSIEIHNHVPSETEPIYADTTQIHQVIINLCTNASHAMKNEEGILEIYLDVIQIDDTTDNRLSHLDPGPYVQLRIKDNGSGIEPRIQERIFDPYFTTKEIGHGTGMGLTVVHGIVQNHNGAIMVDSRLGKGTTFTLVFPAAQVSQVIDQENTEPALEPSENKSNETILLVDDEEDIVAAGTTILEKMGYRVKGSSNPEEALSIFQSSPFDVDVVISDVTMPKMSGVELAKKIREIRSDVPIIICTGHSHMMDEEKAKTMDIDAFSMKPLTGSEISKLIREVISNRQH